MVLQQASKLNLTEKRVYKMIQEHTKKVHVHVDLNKANVRQGVC